MEQVAQYGGSICSGSAFESQACNTQSCAGKVIEENNLLSVPAFLTILKIITIERTLRYNLSFLTVVDCQLSTWSTWVACSATCGGGTQHRSRVVEKVAQNGGVICSGSLVETQTCNTQTCVPPQGKVTEKKLCIKVSHLSHHT